MHALSSPAPYTLSPRDKVLFEAYNTLSRVFIIISLVGRELTCIRSHAHRLGTLWQIHYIRQYATNVSTGYVIPTVSESYIGVSVKWNNRYVPYQHLFVGWTQLLLEAIKLINGFILLSSIRYWFYWERNIAVYVKINRLMKLVLNTKIIC